MAAKFDGKHARANMWVTHQNLAKAKGGRPLYQPPPRKPRVAVPASASASASVAGGGGVTRDPARPSAPAGSPKPDDDTP